MNSAGRIVAADFQKGTIEQQFAACARSVAMSLASRELLGDVTLAKMDQTKSADFSKGETELDVKRKPLGFRGPSAEDVQAHMQGSFCLPE